MSSNDDICTLYLFYFTMPQKVLEIVSPSSIIILMLTIISYLSVSERSIYPDVPKRMELQSSILSGTMEPPYQYRVMKPLLGISVQTILSPFVANEQTRHTVSYQIIIFPVFFGIYFLMYRYLRLFFTRNTSLLGLCLLAALIPLAITSIWEEGDYITLLLYLAGLNLMFTGREKFLPVIFLLGIFNRDQIIFMLFFYAAFLYHENRLSDKRSLNTAAISFVLWLAGYLLLRAVFGFRESAYTFSHNMNTNIQTWKTVTELWAAMILIFALLSIRSFRMSNRFFRAGLVLLILYISLFFFFAIISQLAKFLPAYLILIPMALQLLTGEYTYGRKNDAGIHLHKAEISKA